jgi:hypothetical protein
LLQRPFLWFFTELRGEAERIFRKKQVLFTLNQADADGRAGDEGGEMSSKLVIACGEAT